MQNEQINQDNYEILKLMYTDAISKILFDNTSEIIAT